MPSPEQIKAKISELNILGEYEKPGRRENTVWAANEYGGHFRLYKQVAVGGILSGYRKTLQTVLSVSGEEVSRDNIVKNFTEAIGEASWILEKTKIKADGIKFKGTKRYVTWQGPIKTSV